MPSVETVRGPVDVGDLGTTLMEQITTMLVENPRRYFTAG
jgi:predicted metal-dependent phosphotriesterase family hydrolase